MVNITDLHFAYRSRTVFTGLNMQLSAGHIYGLLGRNGTGKSTLLRCLAGFLFPQKGQVNVLGYEPGKRRPSFLEQVFLVPEDIQLPSISLDQWLQDTAPLYTRFDQHVFERCFNLFDLPVAPRLTELSYGQQKKVLISFALATNASLLLLDEPTNGLDIVSKNLLRKVIAGAIDENKCILISTHQIKDLEQLIDRILIIDEGRILFNQGLDEITQKLLFKFSMDEQEEKMAIYREACFRGNALILPNYLHEENRADLEMLYKAINIDEKSINTHFR